MDTQALEDQICFRKVPVYKDREGRDGNLYEITTPHDQFLGWVHETDGKWKLSHGTFASIFGLSIKGIRHIDHDYYYKSNKETIRRLAVLRMQREGKR